MTRTVEEMRKASVDRQIAQAKRTIKDPELLKKKIKDLHKMNMKKS